MLHNIKKQLGNGLAEARDFLHRWGAALGVVLAAAFLMHTAVAEAHRTLLQQGIAEEVLRFHVLANSDSEEDQRVKYLVRDEVLAWLLEELEGEADKAAMLSFLTGHLSEVEQVADRVLEKEGAAYRAAASVETCYFPDRTYGACTFPAGWYQALRICLGEAGGRNWWCVLYPKLCFSDCLHAVVEEGELQQLEEVLTVEEYESLLQSPKKWKFNFRWF